MENIEREYKFLVGGMTVAMVEGPHNGVSPMVHAIEQWYTPSGLRIRRQETLTFLKTVRWFLTVKIPTGQGTDGQAVNTEIEVEVPEVLAQAVVTDAVEGGSREPPYPQNKIQSLRGWGTRSDVRCVPRYLFPRGK